MNKLRNELQRWLDGQTVTSENIGYIRRLCFVSWESNWNKIVRCETAFRENRPTKQPEPTAPSSP